MAITAPLGGSDSLLGDSLLEPSGLLQTDSVIFKRTTYTTGARGGPVPSTPLAVTVAATVEPAGSPRRIMGDRGEPLPSARQQFKIHATSDPGDLLGAPLQTNDLAIWKGRTLTILGMAVPQDGTWLIYAELIV